MRNQKNKREQLKAPCKTDAFLLEKQSGTLKKWSNQKKEKNVNFSKNP